MNSRIEYKECDSGWIPCSCDLLCMVSTVFVLKYQLDSNIRKPVKLVLTIAESTEALTVIDLTIKTHELILSNMDGVMK